MTTDLNVPMFEDNSVIAFVPTEAYSTVWLVVLEGWDSDRKRVVWYTGLLATRRGHLFKRKSFDHLQEAVNDFVVRAVGLRAQVITDETLDSGAFGEPISSTGRF